MFNGYGTRLTVVGLCGFKGGLNVSIGGRDLMFSHDDSPKVLPTHRNAWPLPRAHGADRPCLHWWVEPRLFVAPAPPCRLGADPQLLRPRRKSREHGEARGPSNRPQIARRQSGSNPFIASYPKP